MTPEWASVILAGVSSLAGSAVVLVKIGRGQGAAKVRNQQIDETLSRIDTKVEKMMNGESKCKLYLQKQIATIRATIGINEDGVTINEHCHSRTGDNPTEKINER